MNDLARRIAVNLVSVAAVAYVSFWALGLVLFAIGGLFIGPNMNARAFAFMFLVLSAASAGSAVALGQAWLCSRQAVWRPELIATAVTTAVVALLLYRRGGPTPLIASAGFGAAVGAALTFALLPRLRKPEAR